MTCTFEKVSIGIRRGCTLDQRGTLDLHNACSCMILPSELFALSCRHIHHATFSSATLCSFVKSHIQICHCPHSFLCYHRCAMCNLKTVTIFKKKILPKVVLIPWFNHTIFQNGMFCLHHYVFSATELFLKLCSEKRSGFMKSPNYRSATPSYGLSLFYYGLKFNISYVPELFFKIHSLPSGMHTVYSQAVYWIFYVLF